MGYVKMPEMFSAELVKALTGNMYTVKEHSNHEEEMAAAWKEYIKEDKKHDKKEEKCEDEKHDKKEEKCEDKKHDKKEEKYEDKKYAPEECWKDDECCCPKKVKFILVLNNAVIINVNAVCEEEEEYDQA